VRTRMVRGRGDAREDGGLLEVSAQGHGHRSRRGPLTGRTCRVSHVRTSIDHDQAVNAYLSIAELISASTPSWAKTIVPAG
jgi:hypothetical protein